MEFTGFVWEYETSVPFSSRQSKIDDLEKVLHSLREEEQEEHYAFYGQNYKQIILETHRENKYLFCIKVGEEVIGIFGIAFEEKNSNFTNFIDWNKKPKFSFWKRIDSIFQQNYFDLLYFLFRVLL